MSLMETNNSPYILNELNLTQNISPKTPSKSSPSPVSISNTSVDTMTKSTVSENTSNTSNTTNTGNQSSYKYLSWREKDRRRRFREEWRHMWLVIPHGNFEVQCLVCRKVMTQRKLDTIKRHTVRRHAEILKMGSNERAMLFEDLVRQNDSSKILSSNKSSITTNINKSNNQKESINKFNGTSNKLNNSTSYQVDCTAAAAAVELNSNINLSDCRSVTSSSSLSPMEQIHNTTVFHQSLGISSELDSKFFVRRSKYNKKNKSTNQISPASDKSNSLLDSSTNSSDLSPNKLSNSVTNNNNIRKLHNGKLLGPNCDFTRSNYFPIPSTLERYRDMLKTPTGFSADLTASHLPPTNINGSCPNTSPSNPTVPPSSYLKCPWCHEDFSNAPSPPSPFSNPSSPSSHHLSLLFNHIQHHHQDKLMLLSEHNLHPHHPYPFIPPPDMSSSSLHAPFPLTGTPSPTTTAIPQQHHHMPSFFNTSNLISFLYYQELMRRKTSQFNSPNSSIESPFFKQPQPQSFNGPTTHTNSSINTTTSNNMPVFAFPQHNQNSVKQSPTKLSAFNPLTSDQQKFKTENHIDVRSNSRSNSPNIPNGLKRKIFSAESLFNDSESSHPPSAFTCPKKEKYLNEKEIMLDLKMEPLVEQTNMEIINDEKCNVENEKGERRLSPISSAHSSMICHALRFGPGQDLTACLKEYVKQHNISAAFILSCCGSVKDAKIRLAETGANNNNLEVKNYQRHFEIVSLEGSIFNGGSHLHISLSDCEGKVIGGHVAGSLIIHTTAEVLLGQMQGVKMIRQPDLVTGYSELSFLSS